MKKKHLNFKYLTMAGYNLFMFNLKAKVRKILVLSVMFFVSVVFAAAQQNLRAVDDYAITGPMQKVRVNVLANDTVTCSAYTLNIISNLNPATQGIATVTTDGFIDFDPALPCRNTTVTIVYGLTCNNVQVTANLTVDVTKYNLPVNIIDETLECYEIMPTGVTFSPGLKYVGKSVKNEYQDVDRLDGFSMSLVGDLNGDHKPEIIAMGITSLLDGWEATGTAIIILNGQTGAEIYRYNLSNLGGSYKLRYYPRHNSVSKLAIADLDRNGIGDIIIAETGSGGRVHRIEPVFTGTTITGMTKKWTGWTGNESNIASFKSPITGKDENTYGSPLPYIADINADGIPEVIVYNKIYNGVTGELVCTLQTLNDFDYPPQRPNNSSDISTRNTIISDYAYVGRRPGSEDDDHVPCMVIADIDGNGILDIIAGSKVYIMKDNNGKPALDSIIHGPSSITAQKGTGTSETTTYVADGFTAVADIDLDGNLDVIVLAPAESGLNSTTEQVLYVWDPLNSPATPKAATYLYTDAVTGGTMSHPFVGDINGALDDYAGTKRLPEICFNGGRFYTTPTILYPSSKIAFHPLSNTALSSAEANNGFNSSSSSSIRGHIIGFTYHANPNGSTPLHQRLKLCWAMEHGDESSCTGITMFDFDNDNIKELCYRDESSLRVISPARKIYIPNTEKESSTGAIRFKYTGIDSWTGFEAPVIADVNMDGSADIVTLVSKTSSASKGFVHVFEHKSGSDPWAPCPPVWNQGIYFPLLINEDLTVPARPQSMLTSYQDVNGNTIYPYNGQWIQQPIVRDGQNFVPVVRHPDAVLQDVRVKFVSGTETEVTFDIFNKGTATLSASTPISFYNG
ncbi:MAG: VCBS repeat-containing protein, partial [Prevotellaceae bacterium]|nr:VCBS repeat-containing protein [Prevotellaceae bacterium]